MIFDTQTARSVGPQGYIFVDTPLCGQIVRVADYTARNIGAGGCRPKVPLTAGMALRRKEWETIPDIFAAEKERSTHPTSERPGRRYVLHFTANPITNSLQRKPRSRLRKSIRCHLDGLSALKSKEEKPGLVGVTLNQFSFHLKWICWQNLYQTIFCFTGQTHPTGLKNLSMNLANLNPLCIWLPTPLCSLALFPPGCQEPGQQPL